MGIYFFHVHAIWIQSALVAITKVFQNFFFCDYKSFKILKFFAITKVFQYFVKHLCIFNHLAILCVDVCPFMEEIDVASVFIDVPKNIQSPGFYHDYPSNSNCSWILINSDPTRAVHFNFVNLNVESSESECLDFVSIQGPSDEEPT